MGVENRVGCHNVITYASRMSTYIIMLFFDGASEEIYQAGPIAGGTGLQPRCTGRGACAGHLLVANRAWRARLAPACPDKRDSVAVAA